MNQHLHALKIITGLLLCGVFLDLATTWLALQTNPHYEQNPLGATLLSSLGPLGTGILMLVLLWPFYRGTRWGILAGSRRARALESVGAFAAFSRWVAVVTCVLGLQGA